MRTEQTYWLRSTPQLPPKRDLRARELSLLSLEALVNLLGRWWMRRAERHYQICAEVEQRRVQEAQQNVAWYQKQAALARSARRTGG